MGHKKMKVQTQTNPKPQGMEVFLSPKKEEIHVGGEKMKLNNQVNQKEEIKVNASNPNKTNLQVENPPKEIKNETKKEQQDQKLKEIEEIIQKINNVEQKLKNIKELELSTFNNIVYNKHLMFKLLFIREKIYTIVKDPQTNKMAIVAVSPPKWGGSGLRYMINRCIDWCKVSEKKTSKGTVLTYLPINDNEDEDIINETDDIF